VCVLACAYMSVLHVLCALCVHAPPLPGLVLGWGVGFLLKALEKPFSKDPGAN
jgi:hypothetical protein